MPTLFEIGSRGKYPQIVVIGDPCSYYLWVQDTAGDNYPDCMSGWISGAEAFDNYLKLRQYFERGKKYEFIQLARKLHKQIKEKQQ